MGALSRISTDGMVLEDSYSLSFITIEAVVADGNGNAYIGATNAEVQKIETTGMTLVASYTGHTSDVVFLVMGWDGYLYSAAWDNEVHKIDPGSMARQGRFVLPNLPEGLAITLKKNGPSYFWTLWHNVVEIEG